jgi:uncharacterized protein YggT (Ycf19 family)
MRSVSCLFLSFLAVCLSASSVSASVFLPYNAKQTANSRSAFSKTYNKNDFTNRALTRMRRSSSTNAAAVAIPGYGVPEQIFVGGFQTFLSIYNIVITARILLSWFPQAQGVAALQPVYQITDPYLNLFRGIIPPIFGLDLSPLAAFFLLSVMTNATAAVGAELTPELKKKLSKRKSPFAPKKTGVLGF